MVLGTSRKLVCESGWIEEDCGSAGKGSNLKLKRPVTKLCLLEGVNDE